MSQLPEQPPEPAFLPAIPAEVLPAQLHESPDPPLARRVRRFMEHLMDVDPHSVTLRELDNLAGARLADITAAAEREYGGAAEEDLETPLFKSALGASPVTSPSDLLSTGRHAVLPKRPPAPPQPAVVEDIEPEYPDLTPNQQRAAELFEEMTAEAGLPGATPDAFLTAETPVNHTQQISFPRPSALEIEMGEAAGDGTMGKEGEKWAQGQYAEIRAVRMRRIERQLAGIDDQAALTASLETTEDTEIIELIDQRLKAIARQLQLEEDARVIAERDAERADLKINPRFGADRVGLGGGVFTYDEVTGELARIIERMRRADVGVGQADPTIKQTLAGAEFEEITPEELAAAGGDYLGAVGNQLARLTKPDDEQTQ